MNTRNNANETKEDSKKCAQKGACIEIKNGTHPLRYYEFTQDEIKALEECDKESFYYRCLPFSTLFATVTYAAMKTGYASKNPHFGMIPKIVVAILMGHIFGRFAYIPLCDEKFRALPANSYLGKTMRKYHQEKCALSTDRS